MQRRFIHFINIHSGKAYYDIRLNIKTKINYEI